MSVGEPGDPRAGKRVLLFSQRNIDRRVWHCSQYEFEDLICAVDDVDLLAPVGRTDEGLAARGRRGVVNAARKRLGRGQLTSTMPSSVDQDHDLFFGVFHFAFELDHLQRVQDWRSRSTFAVAFLVELWTPWLATSAHHLQVLNQFDHVFVFNRHVMAELQRLIDVPVSYLPTATDTMLYSPTPPGHARVIDVFSYGRRSPRTHAALLDLMAEGRLYYSFQTVDGVFDVHSPVEHRRLAAQTLQRSRYCVVYDINDSEERHARTGGEHSLSSRYFESMASGAVVLGSTTPVEDWDEQFGWPDCLIPVPVPEDVGALIDELDADPQRLFEASWRNVAQSLRRHDWVDRWAVVLGAAGLPPTARMARRRQLLDARAEVVDLAVRAGTP